MRILSSSRQQVYRRQWRKDNPESKMLRETRKRASREKISFNLDREDIYIPTHCPVLGMPLDFGIKDSYPTLDRIIPEEGYTKGNVKVISFRANRLKSDASLVELKMLVRYVKKYRRIR